MNGSHRKLIFWSFCAVLYFLWSLLTYKPSQSRAPDVQAPNPGFGGAAFEGHRKEDQIVKEGLKRGKDSDKDTNVFTNIYKSGIWGVGSGAGSYLEHTKEYRPILQTLIRDSRILKIVDYGCGDFQIMRYMHVPRRTTYIGLDVVQGLIDSNTKLYGRQNVKFYLTSEAMKNPGELLSGDLLIIKDVMIHWPNNKVHDFVENVLPNFRFALITNDAMLMERTNIDIELGNFRPIDLKLAPFNLKGLTILKDYNQPYIKRVYLYTNPNFSNT